MVAGQHAVVGGDPGEPGVPDPADHSSQGGGAGPGQPRLIRDICHGPGHRGGEPVRSAHCSFRKSQMPVVFILTDSIIILI